MLRYTLGFALTFMAAVSAVAVANYTVDADGLYRTRAEIEEFVKTYVERLTLGERGLVLAAQERSIKLELARRSAADCVVTGSSHEMQLDRERAPQIFGACKAVVNLAVPRGGVED